jgi:hypothetical protein
MISGPSPLAGLPPGVESVSDSCPGSPALAPATASAEAGARAADSTGLMAVGGVLSSGRATLADGGPSVFALGVPSAGTSPPAAATADSSTISPSVLSIRTYINPLQTRKRHLIYCVLRRRRSRFARIVRFCVVIADYPAQKSWISRASFSDPTGWVGLADRSCPGSQCQKTSSHAEEEG